MGGNWEKWGEMGKVGGLNTVNFYQLLTGPKPLIHNNTLPSPQRKVWAQILMCTLASFVVVSAPMHRGLSGRLIGSFRPPLQPQTSAFLIGGMVRLRPSPYYMPLLNGSWLFRPLLVMLNDASHH